MQFTVSSTLLLNRLSAVSSVISSKPMMQILGNVLFEVNDNKLRLTGTDLELTLSSVIDVEDASGNISIAMPPQILRDTLRELSEQNVRFEINEENLAVVMRTNNGKYDFIGFKGGEFPTLPQVEGESNKITTTADIIFNGISRTLFATAVEDLRPTMTGIYLDITTDSITFVATDAHKMSRIINTTSHADSDCSVILPKKAANTLKNIFAKAKDAATIEFDAKNIFINNEEYALIVRKIEGRYPNYKSVIPTNNPYDIVVDRLAFTAAVKRVAVYTTASTGLMRLDVLKGNLRLTAQDIDFSTSALEQVTCQYDGEPLSIGFKAQLLSEILACIASDNVILRLADQTRAGIVLPAENLENEDLLMLLMPMMLPE
ncbi:MAG: DNA polymerase III subunit beta [Bacteroidales bacterium]|nr:DNA polymerase III subunit beta [Bacteroidales bacterium]